MVRLFTPSTSRRIQLERPKEVGSELEARSDSEQFVNQILRTNYVVLLELRLDDFVASNWDSLTVNFRISPLVNQLSNRLKVRVAPSDVGFANTQHVDGGLIKSYEYPIVNLAKSEQLEDLSYFRRNSVNTSNAHNESQLGFSGNVVISAVSGLSGETDLVPFLKPILLHVLLGSFEDFLALLEHIGLLLDSLLESDFALQIGRASCRERV